MTEQSTAAAAGFKLDTLLKLADVKGTDRRTSLLHFVVRQLVASQPSVEQLPQQLASNKTAADIQVRLTLASTQLKSHHQHDLLSLISPYTLSGVLQCNAHVPLCV